MPIKLENKFIVFPRKDVDKYVGTSDRLYIEQIHNNMESRRTIGHGLASKEFYVCNQDEPYADKVWQVIKEGEEEKRRQITKDILENTKSY